jgi:hypothetical protein
MRILVLLMLAVWIVGSGTVSAGPIPTAPIYTNKLKFRIPFHYDPAELKRLSASEIRLYSSRDRGRSWQRAQAVRPDAGKFNFQAPGDGEYWFIVRTLDAGNREHPDATDNTPGLQVIVDTAAPRLQLDLKQTAPGHVQLSWNATDDNLDPSTLRLEYIQPGTTNWEPVSVIPKASGQIKEWSLPHGGVVAVRGSIGDLARNTAHDEVQLKVSAADQAVPRPRAPGPRQPIAGPGASPFEDQALSLPEQFPGTDRVASRPVAETPKTKADSIPFSPLRPADESAEPRHSFVSQHSDEFPGAPVIRAGRSALQEAESEAPPETQARTSATSDRLRVVNTKRFQLGYKLHDIDASQIAAVELYITQDNGATWYRYGEDDDKQSPAQIEVPKSGTYGFALGVRTKEGRSTEVPQKGDPPALEVLVDQTPPQIELLPLKQGRGRAADKVLIEWKYTDDFPADQPIALYYAAASNGPWHKISAWTEDTGRFVWTVDDSVPGRFLVRVEARDKAGNVRTAETPKPVLLNLTRPTARILGVESPQKSGPQQ